MARHRKAQTPSPEPDRRSSAGRGATQKRGSILLVVSALMVLCAAMLAVKGCVFVHGQRYRDFITRTPLPPDNYLVLGFLGGREPWDNEKRNVRRLALKLREMRLPGVHVETIENKERHLALKLVRLALDRNLDGELDAAERAAARIVLYGQSFGGAAVAKLAHELKALDIPVLLAIQVDSVGRGDDVVPSNVRRAANLYQDSGWFIRGEPEIRAEDPSKTKILGNFRYDYRDKNIDLSEVSWLKKIFRTAHTKMDFDPDVWTRVEELILNELPKQGR